MLEIKGWSGSVSEMLNATTLTAERRMAKGLLRPVIVFQEHPDVAIKALSGIHTPVHQRIIVRTIHAGAVSNVIIGSRGTSKTSTVDVQFSVYRSLFFPKREGIILSASGFRGGQLILNDAEKYINGQWVDQQSGLLFLRNSVKSGDGKEKHVHRAQNYWKVGFSSESGLMTVPTNDPEKLRGIRAHDVYPDEFNFMDPELMAKVADSFTNVLADFATGGDNADANCFFYTTTVDYGWREAQKVFQSAYEGLRNEMDAVDAAYKQDWETYGKLEKRKLHRTTYVCFDYTDTIIRRHITTRDGRVMQVTWPDKKRKWRQHDQGIPFTVRDPVTGRLKREGLPIEMITTYPINFEEMEGKLLSGETSEPIWLAEQRNVVDSSSGDVYPHAIVDHAVCKGNRFILHHATCGTEWATRYKGEERHFVPPVMWNCTDPCVLGVDYAPGSRDYCAFVIIRVGPLAKGPFNPMTGLGKTEWSNVIWAEQHKNSTGENVAEKIRAFATRYNLVYIHDPYEQDHWKLCRAVGMDGRGGGNTVRDALVFLNRETLEAGEFRIYDPLDPDERLNSFRTDPNAKPMLDVIMPTGPLNDKLVEYTLGQMTNKLLYVPADIKLSDRPMDRKYDTGYTGARILEYQLRALQQKPTEGGYRKFYMKAEDSETGKKDMWAAFIYAAKQLRAHQLRARHISDAPPPLGAVIATIGGGKNHVRAIGARRL